MALKLDPENHWIDDLPVAIIYVDEAGEVICQNKPMQNILQNFSKTLPPEKTNVEINFKSAIWLQRYQDCREKNVINFFDPVLSLHCKMRGGVFNGKKGFWLSFIEAALLGEAAAFIQAEGIQSAKLKEMSEMAAGIAHEINNPLTVIYAKTHFLKEFAGKHSTINTDVLIGHLDKIHQHSERIFKIVNGMRSFSRDSRRDSQQPTKVDRLVQESLALVNGRIQIIGVEVINSGVSESLAVKCWPSMLMQVFVNLFKNAIDSIQTFPFPKIYIDTEVSEGKVRIFIRDSGPGVDPEIENKIFSPFFTTKPVGEGTGIGLSICMKIMKDHGGRLYLDRSRGDSCFAMELPIFNEVAS